MKVVCIVWFVLQSASWVIGDFTGSLPNSILTIVKNLRWENTAIFDCVFYHPVPTNYGDLLVPQLLKSSTFADIAVTQLRRHFEIPFPLTVTRKPFLAMVFLEHLEQVTN